jgi:UDP-N-acetyl-D-mannosaminuronic acid transferase (WecB/TagA/CpsF family)
MEQWIQERGRPHWIAVTGSHGALEAHKRPDFRAILHSADLSVPDGMWAARVDLASNRVFFQDESSVGCEIPPADLPVTEMIEITRL